MQLLPTSFFKTNNDSQSASDKAAPTQGQTPIAPRDWRLGFVSQDDDWEKPAAVQPLSGTLPADLNGTLYRNGPGRFDVYGERLSHWFDGDGKITKVDIHDGVATYQSRFVATARKAREDAAQTRLFSGFALKPRGGLWGKLRGYGDLNNANTNVIVHAGRLLALQEGGLPHRLDSATLATHGIDTLRGLPLGSTYTAHPKPHGDSMWGFSSSYGRRNTVRTYCTDAAGVTKLGGVWEMPFAGLIHDFCLTATKAVFIIPPWTMDPFPWRYLFGLEAMDKLLKWTPELQTRVITMDLTTFATTFASTEPTLLFHTVNAWDTQDGGLVLDACCMPDEKGIQVAIDVMHGQVPERHIPVVHRLQLDAQGQVTKNAPLFAAPMDFPRIAAHVRGQPHRHVWGIGWPEAAAFLGQPVHVDLQTGCVDAAPMGPEEYASECALAPKAGAQSEADAYLLTVVLNAPQQRSELRIYDAGNLAADAICRQALPQVVPHGFHGNWVPRGATQAIA